MTNDLFQPVATTLQFRKRQRTHIDLASYGQAPLDDYDLMMTGSVKITVPDGIFRVPAIRYEDGSIETAEVIMAQPLLSPTQHLGTLILSPGFPELAVVWSRPGMQPLGSTRFRLSVTDDDSVVRLPLKETQGAAREDTIWRMNPTTPIYFLRAYGVLGDRVLPDDCDEGDTLESLIHRHGADRILGSDKAKGRRAVKKPLVQVGAK